MRIWMIPLIAAAMMIVTLARAADNPAPDTTSYTLFDPVPADQMRAFETDRPGKSSGPYTVDAGHFQYEADLVNWIYDRYNNAQVTTSNFIIGDPLMKLGVTHDVDIELALAPVNFSYSHDRNAQTHNTASGFGDTFLSAKYNFLGNDGGDYAFAIMPYVKAPTAAHNLGNNHWEGGGYITSLLPLPMGWSVNVFSQFDLQENAALNGYHANFQNIATFNHPLFSDDLTASVEFWSDVSEDVHTPTQYTGDLALAWMVNSNLQFDVGTNIGLDKAAPDFQSYVGISQRF